MSAEPLGVGKLSGELLSRLLAGHQIDDQDVVVGPGLGQDAAVVRVGDQLLVAKSDPITFVSDRAANYLINVNANDLACLGATPRWLLVTALFPAGQTTIESVEQTFRELQHECDLRDIALIGGHTEITAGLDRVILVGQMLGLVDEHSLIVPGKAKPGDRLLLTRPIAIEGSALLAIELHERLAPLVDANLLASAREFLTSPGISIAAEASLLTATGVVTALHDPTEGGLATGIREMALPSNCGAVTSRATIPVFAETRAIADALGLDPLGMLASGSLLAAIRADGLDAAEEACRSADLPFAWIGKLTPSESGFVLHNGADSTELPVFDTDEVARALISN